MRAKQSSLTLSLLLTLCLCANVAAQQAGRIESMKLLTPSTGWAATNQKLFWTNDGGSQWKDITPKLSHKRQAVSSVFFLDASTGWALLNCGDDRDIVADAGCLEIASTLDAGQTWSVLHERVAVPVSKEYLEDRPFFSGQSWLEFIDPQHGWEILRIATGSGPPPAGEMLRTVDGGKTWLGTKDLPAPGRFHFLTSKDGWVTGEDEGELFATHDAGDSWQKTSLPDPAGLGQHLGGSYGLPAFENERRGFVWVQYTTGPSEGPNQQVLPVFVSEDGGRSWRQDRTLPALPTISSAGVIDSVLIAAHSEPKQELQGEGQCMASRTALSLFRLGPDRVASSSVATVPSEGALEQISFISREQGWARITGRLFATQDAGRIWTDVTPSEARPRPPVCAPVKDSRSRTDGSSSMSNILALQPASGSNVSTHLGFDITRVPCPTGVPKCTAAQSLTVMQAWMNSSPYYDTSVYLPGSPNRGTDIALTSAWVQGAQQQGWGLIPIWFGPQPPCACYYGTGKCTQFPTVYSSDPSADGAEAADNAVNAAQMLGLTTSIINTDVENYYVSTLCTTLQQTAAGQAVQAYVDGFDSELHLKGYSAGVYANPAPINKDISAVSTIPDEIWIAKANNPPQVTIWNQGIKDTLWPNGQRIHQFLIDQPGVTWGGTALTIDYDIDNAAIANANNGAKTYTYTTTSLDYPGATETYFAGINDISGIALINATGQTGTIVGYYQDSSNNEHGFQYVNGTFTPIADYPGAAVTFALGINNLGQMVGGWCPATGYCQGFRRSATGTFSNLPYPGSVSTQANGINDAGQVVGQYYNSTGNDHGFLLYAGNPYTIDAGPSGTWAVAINGDASIAGTFFGPTTSFIEYALPRTWTGTFTSFSYGGGPTYGNGIDNDNDLLGEGSGGGFLLTGNLVVTTFQYPGATSTETLGVNDFGQIVG